MRKGKFPDITKPAQDILLKFDIDPYCGCANLVIAQNWCHSRAYAERVLFLLNEATNEDTARKKLKQAALEFSRCEFPDLTAKQRALLEQERNVEVDEQFDD